ncbi:hypothetical protein TNCV_547901 [Trichonephila clavipes]|nr:hypothetical protein TNCV_547901 [Trichonephila clavipes]
MLCLFSREDKSDSTKKEKRCPQCSRRYLYNGLQYLVGLFLQHPLAPEEVEAQGVASGCLNSGEPKVGRGWWCDFLCYVEHGRIRYYRRGTPVNHYSFISHLCVETHKDPVGTALHIQEANMDDTTQAKTHTERAAAGYMTTEKRSKKESEISRDIGFYTRR